MGRDPYQHEAPIVVTPRAVAKLLARIFREMRRRREGTGRGAAADLDRPARGSLDPASDGARHG